MLLLKRSTPSGYQNMAQGKSKIQWLRFAAIAFGWPMCMRQGGSYCENRSSHRNLDDTTEAERLNFCRKYMEQAWQSIDNSVIERLSIARTSLVLRTILSKQEQYQALECSAPAMNLFNNEPFQYSIILYHMITSAQLFLNC